jgi:ParB family chromosome partitioning protein
VLQPLLVRPVGEGYELIAGERRWRAAVEAGLADVPVRVLDVDDRGAMELALIENLQREDLNPIEEAEGYHQLMERHGLTQDEIAQRVGRARATVANALRLLTLPEPVRALIAEGSLSAGHAKALLSLPSAEEQTAVARRVVREGLSVRETERLAARTARPKRGRKPPSTEIPESHLRDLSERLQRKLGTAVRLLPPRVRADGRRTRGEITIEFYTADDLDRVMVILGVLDEGL